MEYEPHEERPSPIDELRDDIDGIIDDLPAERAAEMRSLFGDLLQRERELPIGPVEDVGQPYAFHFRESANVLRVPPDVRDDWLAAAYEAACLLRDRSVDQVDREAGASIIAELKERFGPRLPEDR
jgi:hypothetical protein